MNRAKLLLIACLFGLFSSPAFAQCSGQPGSGQICGNDTAATGLPGWKTQSSLLDRNFGAPSAQGTILNRGASLWSATSSPVLGLPNTTTGSLGFAGSSGGTVTVKSQDTAGTWTFKWPTTGGSNGFVLTTDGSGNSTWSNPSAGGTVSSVGLALPNIFTVSGSPVTISGTLTGTLATQSPNLVWAGPATGSPATPTFRSLVGTDLPNPSTSSLGGIQAYVGVSSQWIRSISSAGVPASSQPAFSDISGSLGPSQCPNPSASTLGCIESLTPTTSLWINQISTSGVPIATQPGFSDLTGSATLSQLPTIGSSAVLGNNSGGTAVPSALSASQVLDFIGTTQGNVLYRNGTTWTILAPGTNGQVLTTGGAAANPTWTTVTGTGTVTSIATNNGITGGTITTTGTLGLASIASNTLLANTTGGSTFPSSTTPSALIDTIGSAEGDILYRGASAWLALAPGTSGQVLQTQGAGSTPQWASSVTSVTPGNGLVSSITASCSQTAITGTGTLSTAQCVNPQTGTSYAILNGDRAKLVTAFNAAAQAYSLAQAGAASNFQAGWYVDISNISTNALGAVTITPTTSTINSAATLVIRGGQSVRIVSDGTNYQTSLLTGIRSVKTRAFTSTQTYTPTTGLLYATVECLGAGGGGGGAASTSPQGGIGGSGAAGSRSVATLTAAQIGASQSITIGAAGTAATAGTNNGGDGGTTSFGALCTAPGGGGGKGGVTGGNPAGGTPGATGTGDISAPGQAGNSGFGTPSTATSFSIGGSGGSSIYGSGGPGLSYQATTTGAAAVGFGSGGAGGASWNTATAAGGAGTPGIVNVTEFLTQ